MPIITLEETKYLLNYTDNTYDVRIKTWIPYVQEHVCQICNQRFINQEIQVDGDDFVFVSATNPTITTVDEGFTEEDFVAGLDVYVSGTYLNDGIYEISVVTSTVMTMTIADHPMKKIENENIDNEDLDDCQIQGIRFPPAIKPIVANMIRWNILDRDKRSGVQTERIGNYAVTYFKSSTMQNYPDDVVGGLNMYMVVAMG